MSENIQENVNQSQGATKKCKYCQSDIPKKAKVCPVCRKKQKKGIFKWIVIVILALIIIGAVAGGGDKKEETTQTATSTTTTSSAESKQGLTEEKYNSIDSGMTYDEVVALIGEDGTNISETEIGGVKTSVYEWKSSESFGNATITFSDGKVVNKAQFGVASGDDVEITLDQFNAIETGMTYDEVVSVLGGEGSLLSESDIAGSNAQIYMWSGTSLGANANVTFSDGKVIAKAQSGLK